MKKEKITSDLEAMVYLIENDLSSSKFISLMTAEQTIELANHFIDRKNEETWTQKLYSWLFPKSFKWWN